MRELEYPFESQYIIRKKRGIKKALLAYYSDNGTALQKKKIAILGGSTTNDIKDCMELFLLNHGFEPEFYESDYGQYWQDVMFDNEELDRFAPDIIYIHTSNRNINEWPQITDNEEVIERKLLGEYERFKVMWDKAEEKYKAVIIQNNMENPAYRLLGNMEATDSHGRINFINRLNQLFYEYCNAHKNFYINDINYLSASFGLDKWNDESYWYLYKYSLSLEAVPVLCHNIANIIKALYGKNKKAFALDMDNTLWGGVISEEGADGIKLGPDTPTGQAYSDFQRYIKSHKDRGILLNICSKNEEAVAKEGLMNSYSELKEDDFLGFKANWNEKSNSIIEIAGELNILPESFVFVDDNPVERDLVKNRIPGAAVPELSTVECYIKEIDKNGYFECVSLSTDDVKRNEMYKSNMLRQTEQNKYTDYSEFLKSLEMTAEIAAISDKEMERATQLSNKCNQFNLTNKKISSEDMNNICENDNNIALYGKLKDKYGDNGLVTVLLGRGEKNICYIDLWVMSCRVLKRDMENAVIDKLVEMCRSKGIDTIRGYYNPSSKNGLVKELYGQLGFTKTESRDNGDTYWELKIDSGYISKNKVITMEEI
ncbi:MAG: HAD-IIIC family phosphatase [Lachnospiraceae bacterium]|nr:HAD-IIIC family phosphatase [Lachnospiraceae bacterium]